MDLQEWTPGHFGQRHFGGAKLGDSRRSDRLVRLADQILAHPQGTLPAKLPDPCQLDAAYRLFADDGVTHAAVIAPHLALTHARMAARPGVTLIAHDDTELNFSGRALATELGVLAGPKQRGILAHNSLVVSPQGHILGLAGQLLLCPRRKPASGTKAASRNAPDKISSLWRDALAQLPEPPEGTLWVHLADRGADVTEFLDALDERGWHYVVRSQHDRNVTVDRGGVAERSKLRQEARSWPPRGTRVQRVAGQKGRPNREATVQVSWGRLTIVPPRQARGRERGVPLAVWVVRVWEPSPPTGVKGLEWLLLTDVAVGCLADAWERADWYDRRWAAEEYHKGLKTGIGTEGLQLTKRGALEAAIGVYAVVTVALVALRELGREPERARGRASDWVPQEWVKVLALWRYGVERDLSVAEFTQALARLGGHQNRPSDGPPGWLTLWRGWGQFMAMLHGWLLARKCGGT